jgi:hypothetical protein
MQGLKDKILAGIPIAEGQSYRPSQPRLGRLARRVAADGEPTQPSGPPIEGRPVFAAVLRDMQRQPRECGVEYSAWPFAGGWSEAP